MRLAISLLLAAAPLAAQTGRALSIEDYYRMRTVGNPSFSPDAKWVSFTVTTRVEENNGSTSEVWVVPADASAPARRLSGDGNDTNPQWTDDGRLRFSLGGRSLVMNP